MQKINKQKSLLFQKYNILNKLKKQNNFNKNNKKMLILHK